MSIGMELRSDTLSNGNESPDVTLCQMYGVIGPYGVSFGMELPGDTL